MLVYTSSINLLDFYNPEIRKKPMSSVLPKPVSNSVTLKVSHCTLSLAKIKYEKFKIKKVPFMFKDENLLRDFLVNIFEV